MTRMIAPRATAIAIKPASAIRGAKMIRAAKGRVGKILAVGMMLRELYAAGEMACENALHALGLLLASKVNYW